MPPYICPNYSVCRTSLQWRCLYRPFKITKLLPETCPRSRAPLTTPSSSTSPCKMLRQSNYITVSPPTLFYRCSINIAWRMSTIYFTSWCSPLKRRGSAQNRDKPSQTRSTRNILRQRLPTSTCTHWCKLCPCHRPSLIHFHQRNLTKQKLSSIWWPKKCTKTQHWWCSSSSKPPRRSLGHLKKNPQYPESPLSEMRWDTNHQADIPGSSWQLQGWSLLCRYLQLSTNDVNNQATDHCYERGHALINPSSPIVHVS